jgi:hypothetical protein
MPKPSPDVLAALAELRAIIESQGREMAALKSQLLKQPAPIPAVHPGRVSKSELTKRVRDYARKIRSMLKALKKMPPCPQRTKLYRKYVSCRSVAAAVGIIDQTRINKLVAFKILREEAGGQKARRWERGNRVPLFEAEIEEATRRWIKESSEVDERIDAGLPAWEDDGDEQMAVPYGIDRPLAPSLDHIDPSAPIEAEQQSDDHYTYRTAPPPLRHGANSAVGVFKSSVGASTAAIRKGNRPSSI